MITFGDFYKKEQEEYSKLTDEEILQRLIKYIYKHYHNKFEFDDVECKIKRKNDNIWYNRRYIKEYGLDDYELNDMMDFLETYPYMKCISFEVLHDIQKTCNSDVLCAGWCGCFEPRYMLFCLEENL